MQENTAAIRSPARSRGRAGRCTDDTNRSRPKSSLLTLWTRRRSTLSRAGLRTQGREPVRLGLAGDFPALPSVVLPARSPIPLRVSSGLSPDSRLPRVSLISPYMVVRQGPGHYIQLRFGRQPQKDRGVQWSCARALWDAISMKARVCWSCRSCVLIPRLMCL